MPLAVDRDMYALLQSLRRPALEFFPLPVQYHLLISSRFFNYRLLFLVTRYLSPVTVRFKDDTIIGQKSSAKLVLAASTHPYQLLTAEYRLLTTVFHLCPK